MAVPPELQPYLGIKQEPYMETSEELSEQDETKDAAAPFKPPRERLAPHPHGMTLTRQKATLTGQEHSSMFHDLITTPGVKIPGTAVR